MDFKTFCAGPDDNDRRLDKIIRKFIPDIPLSQIYKLIRKGLIKVNQKKTKEDYHVQKGDEISIADFILTNASSTQTQVQEPEFIQLPPIVFRNNHLLILNKPYDTLVQGTLNSLDKLIQKEYKSLKKEDNSLSFTPGPLHRLDRKTSGLLVFSQSLEGARWFSKNIQTHVIQKRYIAVLEGHLKESQIWTDYISKNEDSEKNFHTVLINQEKSENAKKAVTIAKPLLYGNYKNVDISLVELEIQTGKMHQIRSQSAIHGHPLFGDTAYGGQKFDSKYPDFFLQAYSLTFPKDNPLDLPQQICIEYSNELKSFLKHCDVTKIGV